MRIARQHDFKRSGLLAGVLASALMAFGAANAPSARSAEFGIEAYEVGITANQAEDPYTQAAGHPYAYKTKVNFNTYNNPDPYYGEGSPVEPVRDAFADLPPGLVGNPTVAAKCTLLQLSNATGPPSVRPLCPTASQVGKATVSLSAGLDLGFTSTQSFPLFNMDTPPGVPARFGFNVAAVPVVFDAKLRSDGDYGLTATFEKISEGISVTASTIELWGVPGDPSHDPERACPGETSPFEGGATCTAGFVPQAFLRMPTSCTAPGQGLPFNVAIDSWFNPGALGENGRPLPGDQRWKSDSLLTPNATTGCSEVPVKGKLSAAPTALDTETSSGLDVHVEVPNAGLENPTGIASSDIKDVKVTFPRGMTINPSQAEGLGVCSPAQYASSRLEFHPDGQHGCPSDSKVGVVSVKTPLLNETLPGNVYVAKAYDNPFNSLLALYIVIEEPQRGILIKQPGEVRLNETTGRIEAEFDNIPQTPFDTFDFHFREGARAPLVTPSTCGTYETEAVFTPWSDPAKKLVSNSSFQIVHGIGGSPCPNGAPGFKPLFSAGAINNNAGSYSPFNMRLQRNDGEQDMTRFSATLPPGVVGKLAGLSKCPESAIGVAKSKSGLQEIASPSCPASSEIGHSLVGAGVGSVLTYVPGKLYLGGPHNGDPLSVIAITPAVAGPFDVGTVAVQAALTLNPKTAEVEVDGAASDPIPHILKGIPVKLRDLRVYVDKPNFTLNPTSCDESSTKAILFGGGANPFTSADDNPVSLADRFQAASCASLGFKPRLGLELKVELKGGTKRGGHPGLLATYRPRSGDANVKGLVVRLPRSAFLDQAHIRTICTRVQFAAKSCPPASVYGHIKAWTPLLEEPLEGPVYLRSSNHKLPDLVFDLHGLVDVEVSTRIDSVKGGIRASVESAPDAPISKVLLRMQGAKKGLIVNSRNLCGGTNRANVEADGQNGKVSDFKPVLKLDCGKGRKKKR